MTTRKELIERIQAMQLGTQEMLDAAADDARLIPLETLFLDVNGDAIWRSPDGMDDDGSVYFSGCGFADFYPVRDLRPMSED